MPDDQCLREQPMQFRQHPPEGSFLLRCPGVGTLPMLIQSTLIADTDGVAVVPLAVSTSLLDRASVLDGPIPSDDEMIADTLPGIPVPVFPFLVPFVDVLGRTLLSRPHSNESQSK